MNSVDSCDIKRNVGIDILKVWMSFEVILCHFGQCSEVWIYNHFFTYFTRMAVPVFMIVSFYLSVRFILDKDCQFNKLTKRLWRIYWPLVAWGVIYLVVYNIIALLCNDDGYKYSFGNLIWQVLTGHSYNQAMWFNAVLGGLSILYYIVCKIDAKYNTAAIVLLSLLAVFVTYSGLNNICITLRGELNFPLGRIAEMIPYAGLGLLLYKKKYHNLIVFIVSIVLVKEFCGTIYDGEVVNYHYSGVKLFFCSALLVVSFIILNLSRYRWLMRMATFLSTYSMGIYCIHILVGRILCSLSFYIDPFYQSVLIYLLSLAICYCISKIPNNNLKEIVV